MTFIKPSPTVTALLKLVYLVQQGCPESLVSLQTCDAGREEAQRLLCWEKSFSFVGTEYPVHLTQAW